ncbi:MAG TPA: translation initiation factor IF-2 [Clostridiaceae bacterium]|nr:translation initiation factor IF-2 [Clostridiaceae bacterium]
MGKIKIHEIAKKLGLTSKEILEKAKSLNLNIKSHLSSVTDEEAKQLEEALKKKDKTEQKNKQNKKQPSSAIKKDEPVIIRREVIISDEELVKKEEEEKHKKQKEREKQLGFVERNKNKDFNIVYRNKQTKPLTVEELFGIKKKEEPKKEAKEEIKEVRKEEEKPKNTTEEIKEEVKVEEKPEIKPENKKIEKSERENMIEAQRNKQTKKVESNNNRNEEKEFKKRNNNFNNNRRDNRNFRNNNNNNNRDNRDGYRNNNYRNNNNNNNGNNNFRNNNYSKGPRPMDERTIEKNIKNIMSSEVVEKEVVREYNNKTIEKQKNNKYEENKARKSVKASKRFSDEDINEKKLQDLKQTSSLSTMFSEQDGGMLDYYDLSTRRGKKNKKKNAKNAKESESKQKIFKLTEITIPETISVKDLAAELKKTSSEVIKKLLGYGIMATINNDIDFDTAYLIAEEFGVTAKKKTVVKEEDILFDDSEDKEEDLVPRAPVIVVMGHVDHGKTSLLDAIRSTNVIEGEAGGITQHIGAYQVRVKDRDITFLDTPGHEAFTSMRARGAKITDIAILVVAANDGVMPQTVEAINHAKAANIPIIVAINKIDLPGANIEKVKEELMRYELVPEEWGGDTIYVPISAKTKQNIEQLLEMVVLEADMLDLKVNPHKQAKGAVIEARLDKSKGPIASLLVQRGTLDMGDTIVVGSSIGRIRAMKNYKGQKVKKAGPSMPVEVMGLTEVPVAGETFYEVKDEKMAKHLIERRKRQNREKSINQVSKVTLNNLFTQMEEGKLKQLNLIIKADVQGTVEAVKQSLEKLSNEEVRVKVIHSAVGAVTESDVTLANVSNAIIIAFNVRPVPTAKAEAEKDNVEIKQYSIIYQAIEDVETAMKGMLDPKYVERVIGTAEIRQTFRISSVGTIGGAFVLTGKIERNAGVRVIREEVVIHEGKLSSLKRFKDDAKEVNKGFECGMQIENYNDIKEGDIIEAFVMDEVKR